MVTVNGMSRTKLNKIAFHKNKEIFTNKGINRCENCGFGYGLSFAHKHKRVWYYDKPSETLWDESEVILLCSKCHLEIEVDRSKTEDLFNRLRSV